MDCTRQLFPPRGKEAAFVPHVSQCPLVGGRYSLSGQELRFGQGKLIKGGGCGSSASTHSSLEGGARLKGSGQVIHNTCCPI